MRFRRSSSNPSRMASLSPRQSPQESPYLAETKPYLTAPTSKKWVRFVFFLPPAPSPPPPLRRPNLALIQPEVVRHLVPDRILHQLREVLRTARQALVRTLENRDAVRHRIRFEHTPPGQRTPFIETQQRLAARHSPARQLPRVRLGFHDHGDILQPFAKARRNAFIRGGHQTVKLGGLHGRFGPAPILAARGRLLAEAEWLHLRDVLVHDAQFSRALAGELQLKVHDLVVALILVIELQFVALGFGEEER